MPTTIQITNEELLKKLEESYLDFEQKLRLIPLIPAMNDEERKGLINLIDQADEMAKQKQISEKHYQEKLVQLNEEYVHKMNQLEQSETKLTRTEFEKLSNKQEGEELEAMEIEMNNI